VGVRRAWFQITYIEGNPGPCLSTAAAARHHPAPLLTPPCTTTTFKAEVWMDDYAPIYYNLTGNRRHGNGDVAERKSFRREHQCQSFQWYVESVAPFSWFCSCSPVWVLLLHMPAEKQYVPHITSDDTCLCTGTQPP
jgi:hypothetical protein